MPENNTQRGPEVDVVELIANLIAAYSHLFELYNENEVFIKGMQEIGGEEFDKKLGEMPFLDQAIADVYRLRKVAMNVLKDLSPNYNHRYWCLVKHTIASYQYACELWDTDRDNSTYQSLVLDCAQLMYKMLSQFMGVDLATCGRCLQETLDDNKDIIKNEL